jgi:HNH endonuclease
MIGRKYRDMIERLIANSVFDPVTECWVWIGPRDKRASTPYGKINVYENGRTRTRQAHIVSYETFVGPVPEGHELDHSCRYGFCISPNHLEPVLPSVNKQRRIYAKT